MPTNHYQWQGHTLVVRCLIQPRASKDEIEGIHGGELKVRLKAPPIDGQANTQLISYFAKQFGTAKSKIIVMSGQSSRHKVLHINTPSILSGSTQIKWENQAKTPTLG